MGLQTKLREHGEAAQGFGPRLHHGASASASIAGSAEPPSVDEADASRRRFPARGGHPLQPYTSEVLEIHQGKRLLRGQTGKDKLCLFPGLVMERQKAQDLDNSGFGADCVWEMYICRGNTMLC